MTDLVDQMFPPIHRKWTPEFTDFNYWKPPVQDYPLPDFSPPSPALSARSDTSNQSALARLRNFSLVGSRQGAMRMSPSGDVFSGLENDTRSSHLRQISSFEKLSNTLGFAQTSSIMGGNRRSASPESQSSNAYDSEDDEDDLELGADGKRRKRERRRSMTSMPGTLDEMHFGMDDDDDYDNGYGDDENGDGNLEEDMIEGEEDAGDEAFDEDLLAAGEMKNVPFL
jgi:phosphatidate phosphatase LPIN